MATGNRKPAAKKSGNQYDCGKCPGYCCSYPLIEVGKRDIQRLAKHFDITYAQAENRYTRFDKSEKVRSLRQQEDPHFGHICKLFDTKKRQCTVYEARPGVCRDYPEGKRCGYYDFLQFEREHQDDPTFIATT
ncbi:MAG: YkgJ family cysteine cluster protein [Burkholderiales bacterium]